MALLQNSDLPCDASALTAQVPTHSKLEVENVMCSFGFKFVSMYSTSRSTSFGCPTMFNLRRWENVRLFEIVNWESVASESYGNVSVGRVGRDSAISLSALLNLVCGADTFTQGYISLSFMFIYLVTLIQL
jgi:hypothetical protein